MPLLPSPLPPSSSRLTSIYPSGFSFKNHLLREKALLDYGSHFQMESGALHQLPMCCLIPVVIYGTLPGIQQVINTFKKKSTITVLVRLFLSRSHKRSAQRWTPDWDWRKEGRRESPDGSAISRGATYWGTLDREQGWTD